MSGGRSTSRRDFLKAGTALGAAAALGPFDRLVAQDQPEPAPFRFSTSTIMYDESPLEEALDEIAKTGCEAVDIWDAGANAEQNHMRWIEKNRPEQLRQFLDNLGLKLFAFSIYFAPGDRHLEQLEWLKEAGGEVAVIGGGAKDGEPVQAGIDALDPLVEKAEELGIKIAGENHGGSSLNTIASMREYVELAKSPALGMALAPYHVMGEEESVPEAVRAVGSKLFFFYAWQRAEGMAELPGDGTLDFLPVLRALREVEFGGYLNLFTHTRAPKDEMTEAVVASREYVERLIEQLGGEG